MIGNRAQRLAGRAFVTAALVGALVILVLIYARSGGKGGSFQPVALRTSANGGKSGGSNGNGGGGKSAGGGSSPPGESRSSSGGSGSEEPSSGEQGSGESAGSGGPPLARGQSAPESSGPSGTFTGPVIHTLYGPVQVAVAEKGGHIEDVRALQLPTEHPQSLFISERVAPMLRAEVLQAQGAEISIVSGATFTSEGFAQSLQAALNHARS